MSHTRSLWQQLLLCPFAGSWAAGLGTTRDATPDAQCQDSQQGRRQKKRSEEPQQVACLPLNIFDVNKDHVLSLFFAFSQGLLSFGVGY